MERIRKRRGSLPLPFELEYRHIFVVPTLFGFGFGVMLILMALGGLNFNNNMALMVVFIMGSIAQLTTVLAYRNLVNLRVESVHCEPVFCGEPAHFRIQISNAQDRPRISVQGGFKLIQDCVDVPINATSVVLLKQATERRGWLSMATFKLETRYPLGMFKAWAWVFPNARCLVYPQPAKNPPPLPRTGSGSGGQARKGEGDQIHGLRKYRAGDSTRRIAWRASARHDQLFTREMETPMDKACELSWDALSGYDSETRISILTAWVVMADHRQLHFSLLLPGHKIPAGIGVAHRNQCLEKLALLGT